LYDNYWYILGVMICPKCKNDMEAIEYAGVEVDRCKNCKGIWFDVGETEWLFGEDAAAAIDTGDPLVGEQTNQINRYRCPRCDGGMMRKTDPKQKQIKYEECTSCRGTFFDAGEFTDMIKDAISGLLERRNTH
jgi:Zn-finger nucleic acid-binding protein